MSSVQEIENAIDRLGDEEVAELRAWLFDRDIARDAANGKLDSLADEALRKARDGHTKPVVNHRATNRCWAAYLPASKIKLPSLLPERL